MTISIDRRAISIRKSLPKADLIQSAINILFGHKFVNVYLGLLGDNWTKWHQDRINFNSIIVFFIQGQTKPFMLAELAVANAGKLQIKSE